MDGRVKPGQRRNLGGDFPPVVSARFFPGQHSANPGWVREGVAHALEKLPDSACILAAGGLVAEVGIAGAAMPELIGHYNRREKFCCRFAADGGDRNNPYKF
jgi:hypothetical protein